MKRMIYLATAALLGMMILLPSAFAQDTFSEDTDPCSPEQNAITVGEAELQQMAGQPEPPPPTTEPALSCPPSTSEALPNSGGPDIGIILAASLSGSALLVVLGLLACRAPRRE